MPFNGERRRGLVPAPCGAGRIVLLDRPATAGRFLVPSEPAARNRLGRFALCRAFRAAPQ